MNLSMNHVILISALLATLGLSACDRPTVIIPATPVAVPGPAGPQGATGDQGSRGVTGSQGETGSEGSKGETGKTGSTAVIVVPVEPAK